jgi:hypothetical protein
MPKYLANLEVETDLVLPDSLPFVKYEHPFARYTVFLRNISEERGDLTYLSMQLIFEAETVSDSKETAIELAKDFLDYLSYASSLKLRLKSISQVFNWDQPGTPMRECLMFTRKIPHSGAPFPALENKLLETVAMLQAHPADPRLRRVLKWFATAVRAQAPDDQFINFWFVIEIVAQIIKDPTKVPDKCPTCRTALYCGSCNTTPLHRPYPKHSIELLFSRYWKDDPAAFYQLASEVRNRLMHGDELDAIEGSLGVDFADLVNSLGRLAWGAILNQFVKALVDKEPMFLQASQYANMTMSATAHMKIGFVPNFDNPDPAYFPKVDFSVVSRERDADDSTGRPVREHRLLPP